VITANISGLEKNNAFTSVMEHDLVRALTYWIRMTAKAIAVTGEGKNFCAGADLEIGLERTEGIGAKEHRDG
jgi:enoyl-CoA hydratase/carnithine racemase